MVLCPKCDIKLNQVDGYSSVWRCDNCKDYFSHRTDGEMPNSEVETNESIQRKV